jgi:menaquinol-cytochrome c reductase iron-sulfur subunit
MDDATAQTADPEAAAEPRRRRTAEDARLPGAHPGETVTRRRFVTAGAQLAGAVAVSAIALPAVGLAVGPVFERGHATWQRLGRLSEFEPGTYATRVVTATAGIGQAGKTTVFVRRRDPAVDTEPADRFNQVIAITSRCAHVGCPVAYVDAARSFVCPCHGGVYDFRGRRVGGPPPRPLDRFYTRVRDGAVELGPRYSVNRQLRRFAPRDPGESLDGIGPYLYPRRLTTPDAP